MALRTKSRWFAKQRARDPETLASVAAFTIWRLGLNTIKQMRSAHFEIEASPQYFAFLTEFVVFLIQVADRLVFARLALPERRAFTVSLVKRVADQIAENEARLLGGNETTIRRRFIDTFNARADAYADEGFDDRTGPDFGFMRLVSHLLLEVVAPADRAWVADQVMTIEAPQAVESLRKVIDNVVGTAGSILTVEEAPAPPGPLPEMPANDAPVGDPIPPE